MADLVYRTEDIHSSDITNLFVETEQDREVINQLKAHTPVILVGSRGVGKSFLFRVAEKELNDNFESNKVLPVYLSFTKSSLIHTDDPFQFVNWMLSKICVKLIRSLRKKGLIVRPSNSISIQSTSPPGYFEDVNRFEEIAQAYESSYKYPDKETPEQALPSIENFKDAVEDVCEDSGIKRICLLIDEAAHVFRPEQQRQFFSLFRDLRTPYISCNAAVYPGVTSYGNSFQPAHDAIFRSLDRDLLSSSYVPMMREMVEKQSESDSTLLRYIKKQGENFAILAYAASGNPRILLKTLSYAGKLGSNDINSVIRDHYRTEIWSEHSTLSDKYPGHTFLIDWGRKFIELNVLPELKQKNDSYLSSSKNSTCYFWVHRNVPEPVKEGLRLLAYTGIVSEHSAGIKATRSEIGVRYSVNLGCLFAKESSPASTSLEIAKRLTPKRMSEYGMNHSAFSNLAAEIPQFEEVDISDILRKEMENGIEHLDLTLWQKSKLKSLDLLTVGAILNASEEKLKQAHYVGDKRARRMRSAAYAAVYEYLSG